MHQQQIAFENIVGKEEIARNKQFLLFPQCFLLNQIIVPHLSIFFDITFLFAADLEELKIGRGGKGLSLFLLQPNFCFDRVLMGVQRGDVSNILTAKGGKDKLKKMCQAIAKYDVRMLTFFFFSIPFICS